MSSAVVGTLAYSAMKDDAPAASTPVSELTSGNNKKKHAEVTQSVPYKVKLSTHTVPRTLEIMKRFPTIRPNPTARCTYAYLLIIFPCCISDRSLSQWAS